MAQFTPEFLALQAALAGEYSLERELGRGGMGVVYLARDVQLDRLVAIKVLPARLAERPEARERFLREARTAAGLSHPHIVPIHRVGEAAGFVFFVMSYVAGETLGERLRRDGPMPAVEVMRVMREVAWALAHAHGHGIVHRDVKPDNILLEEGTGRALVTDFGIAWRGDAAPVTDPGKIMGTAHFMSPEQAGNVPVDGRGDLYSLGVVGFLAASGRLPFDAMTVPVLLLRKSTEEPPSLASVAPGLPPALTRAVERCLRLDPASRFPDGAALAAALAPESAPSLPVPLRAWLATRNPAQWAYTVFSGVTSLAFLVELTVTMPSGRQGLWRALLATFLTIWAPLIPIVGFHVSQARRLFRSGYSLDDLRAALSAAAVERREQEAGERTEPLTMAQRLLRGLGYTGVASTLAITTTSDRLLANSGLVTGVWVTTLLLLVAMNMAEVPILPEGMRRFFRIGVRERLWNGRLGAWIARKVNAPATSRVMPANAFRATEVALGAAAAELFAALPKAQREQLGDLPDVVRRLEQRAAAARAEVALVESLRSSEPPATIALREQRARGALGETVAALESIRLDLLRLHAGASDLAPLTTLLDAARFVGDDLHRIADAQREADELLGRPRSERRVATPV